LIVRREHSRGIGTARCHDVGVVEELLDFVPGRWTAFQGGERSLWLEEELGGEKVDRPIADYVV
jgi:hypothetical protein